MQTLVIFKIGLKKNSGLEKSYRHSYKQPVTVLIGLIFVHSYFLFFFLIIIFIYKKTSKRHAGSHMKCVVLS